MRIVEILWNLIIQGDHLPDNGRPEHLMWCLHFLKVYPKQGPGCATIGRSERGAVDPRTHQKWVWKFIEAVAELVDIVARFFFFSYCVAIIVVEMHVGINGDVYHRRPCRRRLILMTSLPPTSHKNITRCTTSPPNRRLTLTAVSASMT